MHELQDRANSADGAVDGGSANEFGRQVRVEGKLNLRYGKHTVDHNLKWAERVIVKRNVPVLDADWSIQTY